MGVVLVFMIFGRSNLQMLWVRFREESIFSLFFRFGFISTLAPRITSNSQCRSTVDTFQIREIRAIKFNFHQFTSSLLCWSGTFQTPHPRRSMQHCIDYLIRERDFADVGITGNYF